MSILQNPNGPIMNISFRRNVATLSLALSVLASSTFAQNATTPGTTAPTDQPFVQNVMKTNDKNRDGQITRDEAINQLKNNFDRVDSDGDGKITTSELTALAKRMKTRQRGQNTAPTAAGVTAAAGRADAAGRAAAAKDTAVPDDVIFQTNLAYRDGNKKWKLDLARPKDASASPQPAIVFIHGGGWRSGDKGGGQWRSLPIQYAAKGYVCVSINYRLTDEATVLDCIADCKCAVRWLRAHAEEYNVDPERIGAYGNSAGAHLVSILGLASAEAKLEGDGPFPDESSLVQAVCCSAPPTDFTNWGKKRSGNAESAFSRLFGDSDVENAKRRASPITHVNDQAPPFLIIHGTNDKTVPVAQGDTLQQRLSEAGATDVTYMRIDGAGHGVFKQHGESTMPAMKAFFDRVLRATDRSDEQ